MRIAKNSSYPSHSHLERRRDRRRKQSLIITHQQIQRVPNYTGNYAYETCENREKIPRSESTHSLLILLFALHSSLRCHEKRDRHYSLAPCCVPSMYALTLLYAGLIRGKENV